MGLGSKRGPPVPPRTCRPSTLSLIGNNNNVQVITGAGSEPRCQCCPYGFHIDLDFVRFCESIATGSELKQKREERRARRLQCNSMEVLLGLAPTPSYPSFPTLPAIIDTQSEGGCAIGHELERVVDDFEATLSMSSRNSQSSQVSAGDLPPPPNYSYWHQGREYEADAYQETKNEALQAVRGQMAASLEKLRQLEQQVKMIPVLQVKVSVLQEEKRKLAAQLADMKNKWTSRSAEVPKRDIGVGTLASKVKDEIVQTEKWIHNVSNKLIQTFWQPRTESSIQTDPLRLEPVPLVRSNVHTQTMNVEPPDYVPVPKNDAEMQTSVQTQSSVTIQTDAVSAERKYVQTDPVVPERKQHTHSQTDPLSSERKHNIHVQTDSSITSSVPVAEKSRFSVGQARKSIAIGDGAINDVLCDNCRNKRTRHVACSTDSVRPTSGVNVATQCFSPCIECKERSRLSLLKETVDRESQTVFESSQVASARNSRILEPVEESPAQHHSEGETDSGASEECGIDESLSGSSEDDFDEEDEAEEEEPLQILEPLKPRVHVEPSVEMKAALKVLNDSVHRPQSRNHSKQLVNAIEIVRREWVQISSTKDADAHIVEDYMDYVESLSMELLERVANMADNNGNTALHYAVSHSQWDIVSLLLDSKVCYPQLRNKAGYSPPMLAALAQPNNSTELQVLQRLFSLADVNAKATQHGQTALMLSVSHGRVDVVRLLLQCGADVNVQDSDGSTALMCAAEHGHVQIVRLLLAQPDIDLHLRDNDGSTALSIAMEAGHKDIGLLIYAHMNFHRSNSSSAASSPTVHTAPVSGPSAKKIYHSAS